jgi:3-deoxy-7-phosphoheptulonate synthase
LLIVMNRNASVADIARMTAHIEQMDCQAHITRDEIQTIIGVSGNPQRLIQPQIEAMPGVEQLLSTRTPFKTASREFQSHATEVTVGNVTIGGPGIVVMAGPCAVENIDQMMQTAMAVKHAGATILRGGAFKPRTSPYSFQGLESEGLKILDQVRRETGLPVVSEVTQPELVQEMRESVDMLQIGARNMQNFALLHAVGKSQCPVLLKRGMMSTIEELLMAAEYILSQGNGSVVLCERGIRTFETYTRNTLDINAIPALKNLTHLPVIADPSHGTGRWDLVEPVALAAIAAGADGLMVEVHVDPDSALSDGDQSLKPERFEALMAALGPITEAVGRSL